MQRRTFCTLPLALTLRAAEDSPDPGAPRAAIERWKDHRFGLFIHWGPVSIVGTEIGWSRGGERRGRPETKTGNVPVEVYDNLYRMFDPVKFNPDEWVQLAKDAGMKYLVFTTKHHDGFCNFDSKLTDYRITSPRSPYRKDIVRQLSDACRRGGLDWGVYYSQPDWHHADYRNGQAHAKYIEYLHGQVRELLTGYGPTKMWFFDGLGGKSADWDAPRLLKMMRELEPELVINNRAGLPADNDTPEQRIGLFQNNRPWETCATVGRQWAYDPNDKLRSTEECLRGLVCCAIGDGNLLFNVGPRPDGLIEPTHAARLREMGAFLAKYGESIYGTRGGPFLAPDEKKRPAHAEGFALAEGGWWGGSTHKGNAVYLHILRWPSDSIELPAIPLKVVRHSLLSGAGQAEVKQTATGIRVSVPAGLRGAVDTIVKLELDGDAGTLQAR
ncbi:alpha-L-fucosidase [Paludibaculum fermentans]|uniref:alpha-L-fucosidase n=1 Tax=Paludibaculum fermentans TaxID=1473598 RepID=UPI003EBF27A0